MRDYGYTIPIILGCIAIAVLLFLCLDCGTGETRTTTATIISAHYEPSRTWYTNECQSYDHNSICTRWDLQHHFEPEHHWAYVTSPLGGGKIDNLTLYRMAPNGKCLAYFRKGRLTGRLYGPLKCEIGEGVNW